MIENPNEIYNIPKLFLFKLAYNLIKSVFNIFKNEQLTIVTYIRKFK